MALQAKGRVRASLPEPKPVEWLFGETGTKYAEFKVLGFDFLDPENIPSSQDLDDWNKRIANLVQEDIDGMFRGDRHYYMNSLRNSYDFNQKRQYVEIGTSLREYYGIRGNRFIISEGTGQEFELPSAVDNRFRKYQPAKNFKFIASEEMGDFAKVMSYEYLDSQDFHIMAPVYSPEVTVTDGFNGDIFDFHVFDNGDRIVVGNFTTYTHNGVEVAANRIIKLKANNTVDQSFTRLNFSDKIRGIKVLASGKIYVYGDFYDNGQYSVDTGEYSVTPHRLARLNADGTLDETFVSLTYTDPAYLTTVLSDVVYKIAVQEDGKIIVLTAAERVDNNPIRPDTNGYGSVLRFNEDGSVDQTFSCDQSIFIEGMPQFLKPNIEILQDGKILLLNGPSLIRLNSDGSVDTAWTAVAPEFQTSLSGFKVLSDSSILVMGDSNMLVGTPQYLENRKYLVKLNSDGSINESFNPPFVSAIPYNSGLIDEINFLQNGEIVVSGFQFIILINSSLATTGIVILNSDFTIKTDIDFLHIVHNIIKIKNVGEKIIVAMTGGNILKWDTHNLNGLSVESIGFNPFVLLSIDPTVTRQAEIIDPIYFQFQDDLQAQSTNGPLIDYMNNLVNPSAEVVQAFEDWKIRFERLYTSEEYYRNIWSDSSMSRLFDTRFQAGGIEWSSETLFHYPKGSTPIDVVGGNDIKIVSYVKYDNQLKLKTGNPGEIIFSEESGEWLAWHPMKQKWSSELYLRFFEFIHTRNNSHIYSKINYLKDLSYGHGPATWAAYHLIKRAVDHAGL